MLQKDLARQSSKKEREEVGRQHQKVGGTRYCFLSEMVEAREKEREREMVAKSFIGLHRFLANAHMYMRSEIS